MNSDEFSPVNVKKMEQLNDVLSEILQKVLQRQFYGTASVEIVVHDGTIQHFRHKIERIEK